jgi:dTDP-4-dehydrorhamnose reductase
MQKRIFLLGAHGQLGSELSPLLSKLGQFRGLSHLELDLLDLNALREELQTFAPTVIVNASAYTAVDKAELKSESSNAMVLNARVPEVLAQYAKVQNAVLIHFSTDFVFDGQKNSPYLESDSPRPLSVYGHTKLQGERAILESGCQHLIFRTSWLMGAHGQNFLKTMLRLAKEKSQLNVVNDQLGAPTSAKWLANVSLRALQMCLELLDAQKPETSPFWGLYHASSSGQTSWHAYASYAIEQAKSLGVVNLLPTENIHPIASKDYPSLALRPAYSVLSSQKLTASFQLDVPCWRVAVQDTLKELLSKNLV